MRAIGAVLLLGGLATAPALARPQIIATVGPRASDPETIAGMARAGMRIARVNLSHGNARSTRALSDAVRAAGDHLGRELPLLFDLPGGKVRTGAGPEVTLRKGQRFDLVVGRQVAPTARETSVTHPHLDVHARPGERVLLADGRLELEVTRVEPGRIQTRVVRGGAMGGRSGLALADAELPFPSMTATDRRKLKIAVANGARYVGVSLVQSERNVHAVRRALARLGRPDVQVVAKIESRAALEHLDAIVDSADVVMIARGDLGVAVGARLPEVQARIAAVCRAHGKPFIAATNFMSAMIDGPAPSAANRADVARARAQGPRWFMLNETAISQRPVEVVKALRAELR